MPVNPGDTIGTCECPSCGANVSLKVSKNKTIFLYCTNIIHGSNRERCGYRTFWGRVASRAIIHQFEETKEPAHVEPENDQPIANTEIPTVSDSPRDDGGHEGTGEQPSDAPPVEPVRERRGLSSFFD